MCPKNTKKKIETPDSRARRKHLAALFGAGSVLATSEVLISGWQKPTINSIVLPTHASTTCNVDRSPPSSRNTGEPTPSPEPTPCPE